MSDERLQHRPTREPPQVATGPVLSTVSLPKLPGHETEDRNIHAAARQGFHIPRPVRFPLIIFALTAPLFWSFTGDAKSILITLGVCGFTAAINAWNEQIYADRSSEAP